MTLAEQLTTWRAEYTQELAQFEAERESLRAELADAEREVERLKAEYHELEGACRRGLGPFAEGLAACIWVRLQDARQEMLQQVSRVRGNLPGRIKTLDERIAGRRLALAQLARSLEPLQPRHVPEVVKRPAAAPVSPYRLVVSG